MTRYAKNSMCTSHDHDCGNSDSERNFGEERTRGKEHGRGNRRAGVDVDEDGGEEVEGYFDDLEGGEGSRRGCAARR
ncbi:hypothetical protein BCON_0220g00100 [Botryotinia convoluta]|uniref:Uncharacterized protein n=1 Tax=Botryotinia convoluta TaxID=54673 RepID=A0A4Z1HJJ7_9HELO|nr:hypothetical protein BCON_0220g00100 [Botryotinia convoluta]